MKRLLVFVVGLSFLFCASAFAVDQPVPAAKPEPAKAAVVKVAKMQATGKVLEVTDVLLKIEKMVKGKAETKEFVLEKPVAKIKAGDKVTVVYVEKEGKMVAMKVAKAKAAKKPVKAAPAKPEAKPAAPEAPPATK